jgi:hypothetical protein
MAATATLALSVVACGSSGDPTRAVSGTTSGTSGTSSTTPDGGIDAGSCPPEPASGLPIGDVLAGNGYWGNPFGGGASGNTPTYNDFNSRRFLATYDGYPTAVSYQNRVLHEYEIQSRAYYREGGVNQGVFKKKDGSANPILRKLANALKTQLLDDGWNDPDDFWVQGGDLYVGINGPGDFTCGGSNKNIQYCLCLQHELHVYQCPWLFGNPYSYGTGGRIRIDIRKDDGSGSPAMDDCGLVGSSVEFVPHELVDTPIDQGGGKYPTIPFTAVQPMVAGQVYHMVHNQLNPPTGYCADNKRLDDPEAARACIDLSQGYAAPGRVGFNTRTMHVFGAYDESPYLHYDEVGDRNLRWQEGEWVPHAGRSGLSRYAIYFGDDDVWAGDLNNSNYAVEFHYPSQNGGYGPGTPNPYVPGQAVRPASAYESRHLLREVGGAMQLKQTFLCPERARTITAVHVRAALLNEGPGPARDLEYDIVDTLAGSALAHGAFAYQQINDPQTGANCAGANTEGSQLYTVGGEDYFEPCAGRWFSSTLPAPVELEARTDEDHPYEIRFFTAPDTSAYYYLGANYFYGQTTGYDDGTWPKDGEWPHLDRAVWESIDHGASWGRNPSNPSQPMPIGTWRRLSLQLVYSLADER